MLLQKALQKSSNKRLRLQVARFLSPLFQMIKPIYSRIVEERIVALPDKRFDFRFGESTIETSEI
jgi:hypothetical protein